LILSVWGWIGLSSSMFAQKTHIISGHVFEKEAKKPLIGVKIEERISHQGVYSDSSGYYRISVADDSALLHISHPTFSPQTHRLFSKSDTALNFYLKSFSLKEVEILGYKKIKHGINQLSISAEYIEKLPSLLGETDPIKALSLFPGIQSAFEGSSGLIVRGGTPGQNHLFIDGITLYNPYHLLGIISAFNTDALASVVLYKGMYPASYGNRIASVIDVQTKSTINKPEHKFSIGLLSSKVLWNGKMSRFKGQYMLAARVSYLSLLSLPLFFSYQSEKRDNYFGYWLYDVNGNINIEPSKAGRFQLSVFGGRDHWSSRDGIFKQSENILRSQWGNLGTSLTHNWKNNQGWKGESSISTTSYTYARKSSEYDNSLPNGRASEPSQITFGLGDVGLQTSVNKTSSQYLSFSSGLGLKRIATKSTIAAGENGKSLSVD